MNYKNKYILITIIVLFLILAGSVWYLYGTYKKSVVYNFFPDSSITEQGCIVSKVGSGFLKEFSPIDSKISTQDISSTTTAMALPNNQILDCIKNNNSPAFVNDKEVPAQ